MNKTDRQLAIMLELQRTKVLRAEDMASLFETSVRTIYRDIQALSEMGVPIFGAPGHGYSLMEGYFLPPISFSAEETVALLMGTDFIEQRLDGKYGIVAQAVRRKIEAILPEQVRVEAARVRETMRLLNTGEPVTGAGEQDYLGQVRNAILERRKIRIAYHKKMPDLDQNRKSLREVAPYGLVLMQGNWILIAHCDLRQDIRHFRLSRMSELIVLDERFEMPHGFNLSHYRPPDDRNESILVRAQPDIVDKIAETSHFYLESIEERTDEVLIHFRVRTPEEMLYLILSWGGDVEVLEPESLRLRIREEAEKIFKRY
ncbi:putative DNA-binding transcriptional regulator YafY [Paenibacillus phyllosphaerae]|uniref:Putative DNA-binding transcriptional regulator YafY n=1 Tax=Paenibacillus phyllosphaerae TaxID=274593 RepID=A0A7W5FNN6_9BACL|nr:YafY family protein [Paenibacillus phyllosphaerae]MBB3111327.1 putative DNA-binding transcriptional regulator YafY [Paenibacillus phyllosphaerae]